MFINHVVLPFDHFVAQKKVFNSQRYSFSSILTGVDIYIHTGKYMQNVSNCLKNRKIATKLLPNVTMLCSGFTEQCYFSYKGVQERFCSFTIHCNLSFAYIAVRDLQSSQRNASVRTFTPIGWYFFCTTNCSRVLARGRW